ncbi:unnamed protein product [Arabidopsis halleri]
MPPTPISSSVTGHNFVLRHMLLVSPTCRVGGKNKKTKRLLLSPIISISSFSSKKTKPGKSLTEKQAKELREMKGGINILHNLNNRCLVSQICVFLNKVKKEGLMVYFYLVQFFLIIALHVDTTMKPLKPDTLRYYMYVGILWW